MFVWVCVYMLVFDLCTNCVLCVLNILVFERVLTNLPIKFDSYSCCFKPGMPLISQNVSSLLCQCMSPQYGSKGLKHKGCRTQHNINP